MREYRKESLRAGAESPGQGRPAVTPVPGDGADVQWGWQAASLHHVISDAGPGGSIWGPSFTLAELDLDPCHVCAWTALAPGPPRPIGLW